ncbi:MAG: threonylcarbamoyl-AMP synthase [Deltaproteobacteria bacterium]|nr:threonylcarbamoyl-AMP synthase [Deltaproteobacteria bacterium]OQY15503.1 MAG: threonylcarbamoyl-AMP synthase [Desulfobacterium sp. 4572_20]HDH86604.1 threonylcarbamoyl-AMP synthase [Desulfobacteraceae bacterium]MBW2104889.1 threonylcarbamoyl-AMP synthase [Deltaproteobacteria bacterium]MCD6266694.1 threonylcarbamoyl-AMP synthase [Deltaproteobacteria bacterium]
MLLSLNPDNPQKRLISKVVQVLDQGGLIVYPTDTFYGIGCDLFNKKSIKQIYQLKRRPLTKPFSFVCANLKDISLYAQVSSNAYRIMKRSLPGPYTFILEGTRLVPKLMLTKRRTVGIRVPDNKICLAIVRSLGRPIISTSVNLDEPSVIHDTYSSLVEIVIDGGVISHEPSTVVSLIDDNPAVIREGKGEINFI